MILYGVESWALTKKLEELIYRCDCRMLRYIAGVKWEEGLSNNEIMDTSKRRYQKPNKETKTPMVRTCGKKTPGPYTKKGKRAGNRRKKTQGKAPENLAGLHKGELERT